MPTYIHVFGLVLLVGLLRIIFVGFLDVTNTIPIVFSPLLLIWLLGVHAIVQRLLARHGHGCRRGVSAWDASMGGLVFGCGYAVCHTMGGIGPETALLAVLFGQWQGFVVAVGILSGVSIVCYLLLSDIVLSTTPMARFQPCALCVCTCIALLLSQSMMPLSPSLEHSSSIHGAMYVFVGSTLIGGGIVWANALRACAGTSGESDMDIPETVLFVCSAMIGHLFLTQASRGIDGRTTNGQQIQ